MLKDPNSINLIFLIATVLVPIIPAFIFFKWLPGVGGDDVRGTWQGLKIKLTGAFAGYFIIFITLYTTTKPKITPPDPGIPTPLWTVVGTISADSDITPDNQVKCDTDPPPGHVSSDNSFKVSFRKGDQDEFPDIILEPKPETEFPNFTIHLDPKWSNVHENYTVKRSGPNQLTVEGVTIKKLHAGPYNSSGPTPSPITPQVAGGH